MARSHALWVGGFAIAMALGVQLFNDLQCYKIELSVALASLWYPAVPLVPAAIALLSDNPLRAVGGSAFVIPWYAYAYYVDCVLPYSGGGASMIYVAVIGGGFITAIVGVWATDPICRRLGISINAL